MSLGQIFSKPHYGMLLPPSYQEGKYAATGQIYRNPYFRSYTAPGAWTAIYAGMWPAEVNPRTSLELYSNGPISIMPLSDRNRLVAANKANVADVKRYRNQWIMKSFVEKQEKKMKDLEQKKKSAKTRNQRVIIEGQINKVRQDLKKGRVEGRKLIAKQAEEAKKEATISANASHNALGGYPQHGLGLRPNYSAVMPPSMKGELMDITGRNKNYVSVYDINNLYPDSFNLGEISYSGLGEMSLATDIIKDVAISAVVAGAIYMMLKD